MKLNRKCLWSVSFKQLLPARTTEKKTRNHSCLQNRCTAFIHEHRRHSQPFIFTDERQFINFVCGDFQLAVWGLMCLSFRFINLLIFDDSKLMSSYCNSASSTRKYEWESLMMWIHTVFVLILYVTIGAWLAVSHSDVDFREQRQAWSLSNHAAVNWFRLLEVSGCHVLCLFGSRKTIVLLAPCKPI